MSNDVQRVKAYWNNEATAFDAIYSHNKNWFANLLDATLRWDIYRRFEYAMEQAEPIRNRTFLDIGCGTGRYSLELARRGASRVVGVDISESMLELARQRAVADGLDGRCVFMQGDFADVSLSDKFDVTIAIGLFDYIEKPIDFISRIRGLTRDKAIMSFPRLWTWRAPVRKVRLWFKGCEVFFYSAARLTRLLSTAGFRSHKMSRIGTLYCVTTQD